HIDGVRANEDIEEVHQMRVATRRLRGALRVFGDILPPEAGTLHDELRWIADRLAPARDLDVQLERLGSTADELGLEAGHIRPYRSWLEAERRKVQAALDEALSSTRFGRLLQLLKSQQEWTTQLTIAEDDGPRRLRRAYKRLKRRAGELDANSSTADLHKVRIRAKWLRYTAEFFEPAYGQPARRLAQRAVVLQDLLGDFQDGVVSTQRIHEAVDAAAGTWSADTVLALGRVVECEAQRGATIRKNVGPAVRAVRRK